jgi:agmatinase
MDGRPPGPISLSRYPVEPAWLGIPTFGKLPLCQTPDDLRAGEVDIAIGGAPWDGTNQDRGGAHLGPRAIRASHLASPPHSHRHHASRVSPFETLVVCDYGDAHVVVGDPALTFRNLQEFVREILSAGSLPIVLGGDHGITWPCATAVAEHYGRGELALIHLDSHADTAPDFQGNRYSHSSSIRHLIEEGAVRGEHVTQIGLRGYFPPPEIQDWMDEVGIRAHYMTEIEDRGLDAVISGALAAASSGPAHAYLTVDIDVADPSCAPGTGAPEPGGLTSRELLKAVRRVAAELGIVAMDIVEVNPAYDAGNGITARLAHYCVLEAITGTAMRKLGHGGEE